MKDKVTVVFSLTLICGSPIAFFYVLSLPDIPCSKLPIDQVSDCLKRSDDENHKLNQNGRLGAAIIMSSIMWPYGVYYLYQRRKELKQQSRHGVEQ